jgi:tRNA (guanine37-N1)-methyltransferase
MHVDIITVLPELVEPVLKAGVVGRAGRDGTYTWRVIPLRAFAVGRHRITDEAPFGGGAGMVMKPQPLIRAIRWATHAGPEVVSPPVDAEDFPSPPARAHRDGLCVVLLDPGGQGFTQTVAARYAATLDHVVLVCGRYEGLDERVRTQVDETLSVGDVVLTGGELPALCVVDAVVRLIPGALGNAASPLEESHVDGVLEYPQYTRPRDFEGMAVPEVLVGGNHAHVASWRRQQSLVRTRASRPELFARLTLTAQDQRLLDAADGKPPPPGKNKKRRKKTAAEGS